MPLAESYEPFLVAALPLAMSRAAPLSVPEPVSARLLDALPTVQRILNAWDSSNEIVPIEARRNASNSVDGRGTAAFFTGGVDSFFTALRNLDDIDAFIYVHGYDIPLADLPKRRLVSESLRAAVAELGRPLFEVETDLRTVSDRYQDWGEAYHGAALACVGLLYGGSYRRVLVAASHSYADLLAWGSHPLVDPLWSTEAVEFVHEGVVTRPEKLAYLAGSDVALRHLRVCWQPGGSYNCGRCEKCLRTMAGLQLAGALQRSSTFPHELPLRSLAATRIRHEAELAHARENLAAAKSMGADPGLTRALTRIHRRGSWYLTLRSRGPGVWDLAWRAVWTGRRLGRRARRVAQKLVSSR